MLVPSTTLSTWHRRRERKWRILLYFLFLCCLAILARADAVVPWIELVHPRNAAISCRDSIVLRWSHSLTTLPEYARGLVRASTGVVHCSSDQRSVVIKPLAGEWSEDVVVISASVSALTGVSMDDRRWSIPIRRATWVHCQPQFLGPEKIPDSLIAVLQALSTTATDLTQVPIMAPDCIGVNWRFREWRYRDTSIVRLRDHYTIVVDVPCWNLRDTLLAEIVYEYDSTGYEPSLDDIIYGANDQTLTLPDQQFHLSVTAHDIDQDNRFTAVSAFEIDPGEEFVDDHERWQQVCLQTNSCWEIVGYDDHNGRTMLRVPVRRYCGSWRLTNPTTRVRFLVRRKSVVLRIERLCKGTQPNQEYDPFCIPHKDGAIQVCVERRVHNTIVWAPILGHRCPGEDNDVHEWHVRCGERLRIAVRQQQARALTWHGWSEKIPFAQPQYLGFEDGAHWYELLVQQAHATEALAACGVFDREYPTIQLRALFDQGFIVESVALRVLIVPENNHSAAHFEERTFDALRLSARSIGEPLDGRQLEYIPGKGTSAVVRFSRPADLTTINNGGLRAASYDNLHPRFPDRSTSFETQSLFDERLIIRYDRPNVPPQTFEFFIMDPATSPRRQALYMGEILLEASPLLRSREGIPLAKRQQFSLSRIEYPGAALRLHTLSLRGAENTSGYVAMVQGFTATPYVVRNTQEGFRLLPECNESDDCTLPIDRNGNSNLHGTFAVFENTRLYRSEELHAVLWAVECSTIHETSTVRDNLEEVRLRSLDVMHGQLAHASAIIPLSARQAVYHTTRVDLETTHASGIQSLHWAMVDVNAERLRHPLQSSTEGPITWTYDVRLYPRKAVLE